MPLLEALLALALTMLSLATLATLIVEGVHRVCRTRSKDLRAMLEEFFDAELKDLVETELSGTAVKIDGYKKRFIGKILSNPLTDHKEGRQPGFLAANFKPLINLSTEDFFKRLAKTKLGEQIKKKAEDEIDEIVNSLSRVYDAFGVAATDLFKRRAYVISLISGVIVAAVLNVNALNMFQTYLQDPDARAKVIATADEVTANFEARVDQSDESFKNLDEVKQYEESIRQEIDSLEQIGVPIGYSWEKVPGKLFVEVKDFKGFFATIWNVKWTLLLWAFGMLITGGLIGLGGPFWFNIVRKMTAALQVIRGGGAPPAEVAPTTPASADPEQASRDAFKLTGGTPVMMKADARLASGIRATKDADEGVAAAADALAATRAVAAAAPDDPEKAEAVKTAEQAFQLASQTQRTMVEYKASAERSLTQARSLSPPQPGDDEDV